MTPPSQPPTLKMKSDFNMNVSFAFDQARRVNPEIGHTLVVQLRNRFDGDAPPTFQIVVALTHT